VLELLRRRQPCTPRLFNKHGDHLSNFSFRPGLERPRGKISDARQHGTATSVKESRNGYVGPDLQDSRGLLTSSTKLSLEIVRKPLATLHLHIFLALINGYVGPDLQESQVLSSSST
jgi:hypothetical protein